MLAYQCFSNYFHPKKLLLYILIMFCFVSNAQVDSLATKSYEELISLYGDAIKINPEEAFHYATAAYKLSKKQNDRQQIGSSLYFLAKSNSDLSNNALALQQLSEVIEIGTQLKDSTLLFNAYSLKGNANNDIGEESKALNAYLEARKYSTSSSKPSDLILLDINIAFMKKIHRDYEGAITILKDNLIKIKTADLSAIIKERYELVVLMNLADTYLRLKENDIIKYVKEAEYYNTIGLEKSSTNTNTVFYNLFLMNKAIIHFEKQEYEQSIAATQEVATYAKDNNNESLLSTTYFYLGKNYYGLKNYNESIQFLEKSYGIMQSSERKYSNEKELHRLLTLNFANTKELEKLQLHLELFTKLETLQSQEDVNFYKELEKNNIKLLIEEIEGLGVDLSAQKRKNSTSYIIAALLGTLLILSIIFYRRKVQQVNAKVSQVMQKVEALEKAATQPKSKSATDKIPDKKAKVILDKLKAFEENEEFLVQGCTLIYVAEQLNSNTTYLSKVINTYKEKTFNSYLNELRINKALIQLKNDAKLRSYTIKGISEEFGFKRQETFSRAFKQQTGIYPSQYLKKLNEANTDR